MLRHSLKKVAVYQLKLPRFYSTTERSSNYATLNDQDLSYFERLLEKKNVLTEDLDIYNVDWMKWYKGLFLSSSF